MQHGSNADRFVTSTDQLATPLGPRLEKRLAARGSPRSVRCVSRAVVRGWLVAAAMLLVSPAHAQLVGNEQRNNGDQDGAPKLDRYVGDFMDMMEIDVPAFHGIAPDLALAYSSSSGNGPLGVGWSLTGVNQAGRIVIGAGRILVEDARMVGRDVKTLYKAGTNFTAGVIDGLVGLRPKYPDHYSRTSSARHTAYGSGWQLGREISAYENGRVPSTRTVQRSLDTVFDSARNAFRCDAACEQRSRDADIRRQVEGSHSYPPNGRFHTGPDYFFY